MNVSTSAPKRATVSKASVGLAWVEVDFTSKIITGKGWIHQIAVNLNAGPATTAAVRVREGSGGSIILSYGTLAALDLLYADGRIWYEASDLTVEVKSDDATVATTLDVELTLEES